MLLCEKDALQSNNLRPPSTNHSKPMQKGAIIRGKLKWLKMRLQFWD